MSLTVFVHLHFFVKLKQLNGKQSSLVCFFAWPLFLFPSVIVYVFICHHFHQNIQFIKMGVDAMVK